MRWYYSFLRHKRAVKNCVEIFSFYPVFPFSRSLSCKMLPCSVIQGHIKYQTRKWTVSMSASQCGHTWLKFRISWYNHPTKRQMFEFQIYQEAQMCDSHILSFILCLLLLMNRRLHCPLKVKILSQMSLAKTSQQTSVTIETENAKTASGKGYSNLRRGRRAGSVTERWDEVRDTRCCQSDADERNATVFRWTWRGGRSRLKS